MPPSLSFGLCRGHALDRGGISGPWMMGRGAGRCVGAGPWRPVRPRRCRCRAAVLALGHLAPHGNGPWASVVWWGPLSGLCTQGRRGLPPRAAPPSRASAPARCEAANNQTPAVPKRALGVGPPGLGTDGVELAHAGRSGQWSDLRATRAAGARERVCKLTEAAPARQTWERVSSPCSARDFSGTPRGAGGMDRPREKGLVRTRATLPATCGCLRAQAGNPHPPSRKPNVRKQEKAPPRAHGGSPGSVPSRRPDRP